MADNVPEAILNNFTHVLAGSDAFMAVDFLKIKIKVMELPSVEMKVLIVPVPDLPRFKEKPPFGGRVANAWGLVHGSVVKAAQLIIAEGQL